MGGLIEINDTLRISKEQGFPSELEVARHLKKPFTAADFADRTFAFSGKQGIRLYKIPPVRNFLVEDIGGKWLYWGLVHITEVTSDYVNQVTYGKFKIIYLNTPDEMRKAYELIDRNPHNNYFS